MRVLWESDVNKYFKSVHLVYAIHFLINVKARKKIIYQNNFSVHNFHLVLTA